MLRRVTSLGGCGKIRVTGGNVVMLLNWQHGYRRCLALLTLVILLAVGFSGCTPTVQGPDLPPKGTGETPDPTPEPEPEPDPYLVLVNADNPLTEDMEPSLKTVQGQFKLEEEAADALIAMIAAAKEEDISLVVCSAYRPNSTQERLYKNQVQKFIGRGYSEADAVVKAATIVARPGTSEHNTGLAADIVTPSYQTLNEGFAETAAAKWMAANAHKYGFVLRYPKDKQETTGIIFEPWHFRYVGLEHAQKMLDNNWCLEEYLANR